MAFRFDFILALNEDGYAIKFSLSFGIHGLLLAKAFGDDLSFYGFMEDSKDLLWSQLSTKISTVS